MVTNLQIPHVIHGHVLQSAATVGAGVSLSRKTSLQSRGSCPIFIVSSIVSDTNLCLLHKDTYYQSVNEELPSVIRGRGEDTRDGGMDDAAGILKERASVSASSR